MTNYRQLLENIENPNKKVINENYARMMVTDININMQVVVDQLQDLQSIIENQNSVNPNNRATSSDIANQRDEVLRSIESLVRQLKQVK